MASMYSKLCNKQDDFLNSRMSYLHNEQGSPNDFNKKYKAFALIKLCFFYDNIFISLSFFAMSIIIIKKIISCEDILKSYNKKSLIFIL